jgi:hypothetical protein
MRDTANLRSGHLSRSVNETDTGGGSMGFPSLMCSNRPIARLSSAS